MFIDSHAHITGDELYPDVENILKRAKESGLEKIVNIATSQTSLKRGLALHKTYPWVYNTAATTPHDVEKEGESFFPLVEEAAKNKQLVAIGETGLDYFYEHSPKNLQILYLQKYVELAKRHSLPLVFHCREAFNDLFSYAKVDRAVLHCFTGTLDEAKEVVKRGWYISFSGIITFKKSEELRSIAKVIPLEHILIETDAPFLAPLTKRGKVNEPAFIVETAQVIAQVKNCDLEMVAKQTTINAARLFQF